MAEKSSSSWKVPSATNQAKYHLAPLPEEFEATEEENGLLKMYETIKTFERQATRLKEQKAREKLDVREAEFKQNLAAKKRKGRRKKQAKSSEEADDGGDESPVDDESDIGSDEEEEEEHTKFERRAAKLEALRDEVETQKQAMVKDETKQENMREQLLATNADVDLGPALKRKKLEKRVDDGSALLTSMMKNQTPPHDFSEKLGLKPWKGKVLFPSTPDESKWTPPETATGPNDGAFLVELENFNIEEASNGTGNNTVAIKFNAPSDAKRFRYDTRMPFFCFGYASFLTNPRIHSLVSIFLVQITTTLTVLYSISTRVSSSEEDSWSSMTSKKVFGGKPLHCHFRRFP
jgi:hypothetical protein